MFTASDRQLEQGGKHELHAGAVASPTV
jgi:hypothetical protein